MRIARDISSKEIRKDQFSVRAESLVLQYPEYQSLSWVNERRQVVYTHTVSNLLLGQSMRAGESIPLGDTETHYSLSRDLMQPIYGLSEPELAPSYQEVLSQSDLLGYFHPGSFCKVAAQAHGDGVSLPQRPLLEAIAALVDGPAELALLHFAHWGRAELARRRERSGQMGFGQLLEALDPGTDPGGGESALLAAVTMLRVYCSWPGASPMMNLRLSVLK
mgnify:CR=1 FL=1